MEFKLFYVYTFLSLALVGSHAVNPEVYWKSLLPNSHMPKAVMNLLSTQEAGVKSTNIDHHYSYVASKDELEDHSLQLIWFRWYELEDHSHSHDHLSRNQLIKDYPRAKFFFLMNNLHQGQELELDFTQDRQKATFLPRTISDSIPFSSKDLPEIYKKFSVRPDSVEAEIMKQTLMLCEHESTEGEEIACETSLESMLNFSTTRLGEKVRVLSSEVNAKESPSSQKYKIEWVKKLAANKAVVCHNQNYAYAVFYCHITMGTQSYVVSLEGVDGTKVKSVAVCHTDTSKWNPKHVAFQLLKVTPGTIPVCHFLPEAHLLWVPN